jgi:hypothetical protein
VVGCEVAAPYVIGKVWLDRDPAQVSITESANDVAGCSFVKHVKSRSSWGGIALQDEAFERVVSNLTHQAAKAGANVLLMRQKSQGFMGSSASGDAYNCKEIRFTSTIPNPDIPIASQQPVASPASQALSSDQPEPESDDIAKKLMKLKELRDSGVLTEQEYIEKRKGLVDKL